MAKEAVILAAGLGSRLGIVTKEKPKGFLEFDGTPLIEWSIKKLINEGITKIIIGTGYLDDFYEKLTERYPQVSCVKNSQYATTGSMHTLFNMKDYIAGDFLLLESDLLYAQKGLQVLQAHQTADVILASEFTYSNDEVYIETDSKSSLVNMSKNKAVLNDIFGELVGISKVSYQLLQKMCEFASAQFNHNQKMDYEEALVGVSKEVGIHVEKIRDFPWCEIDNAEHLQRAMTHIYPAIKKQEGLL